MSYTAAERVTTGAGTLIAAISGVTGVIAGINSILQTVLLLISLLSVTLVIAVNWDKGTDRISRAVKRKGKITVDVKITEENIDESNSRTD